MRMQNVMKLTKDVLALLYTLKTGLDTQVEDIDSTI